MSDRQRWRNYWGCDTRIYSALMGRFEGTDTGGISARVGWARSISRQFGRWSSRWQTFVDDFARLAESTISTGAARRLRRPNFRVEPPLFRRNLLNNRYQELAVTGEHAVAVANLPPLHKDPFDRILVAQSVVEGITLLTSDPRVAQYPAPVRRV